MLMFKELETKGQIILVRTVGIYPSIIRMNFYLFVHSTQYDFDLSELK